MKQIVFDIGGGLGGEKIEITPCENGYWIRICIFLLVLNAMLTPGQEHH